jgi:hypothetical protein
MRALSLLIAAAASAIALEPHRRGSPLRHAPLTPRVAMVAMRDQGDERRRAASGQSPAGASGASQAAADARLSASRRAATGASLASFVQGYHTGVIGGALLYLSPEFGLAAQPKLTGELLWRLLRFLFVVRPSASNL